MREVTLAEYLDKHGTQSELAAALDVQPSAIFQMVRKGRKIFIVMSTAGRVKSAYEVKEIPGGSPTWKKKQERKRAVNSAFA